MAAAGAGEDPDHLRGEDLVFAGSVAQAARRHHCRPEDVALLLGDVPDGEADAQAEAGDAAFAERGDPLLEGDGRGDGVSR